MPRIAPALGVLAVTLSAPVSAQSRDYSAPAGAPYRAENVTVPTPMGHTLAGTLTIPLTASKEGPVPVIITISGTGPQDRDEYLGFGDYRPFRQIADSLGRRGIAVLRMDDRGTGESKGVFKGATPLDFVQDIRAGLAYLRTRPEIDAARMGIVGHSEGAIDAPMVAIQEPTLKALVLLAGQARAVGGAAKFQLENMARRNTAFTPAQRDSAVAAVPKLMDSLAAVDPYMKFMFAYVPLEDAKKVARPSILILTGETDRQADATQVDEWAEGFRSAGNKDVTGKVLKGLNHLFVPDPDGFPGGYAKLPAPLRIDPPVVTLIADWFDERLGTRTVPGLAGTLVVTNKSPSTATIIDVASGQILATLPTGKGPHEITLSSDGGTAVVTDYSGEPGRTLTVIDVAKRAVVRTIDLGEYPRPHGIVFLPGDSLVAVTSEASDHVVVVSIREGAIRRAVPTTQKGSHMVAVPSNGRLAYTGNVGSNTVSELDLASGRFVRLWQVPEQPEAIGVTTDGKEVWVGSNKTGVVSVVDPSTGKVTPAAQGFKWPYRVLFSPDGRTVLLPDLTREELRFVDRASKRELGRLSFPAGAPQGITITPDGKYVLESLSGQARVVIIDLATRKVVGFLAAGDTPDGIVYTTRVFK
jgi:DNA-binding beta-propeller fold protein YncE/pimeloyl-ACP methyl ester carboxylesterase